ncbi:hypothetical protein M8J76_002838 [Diaphorina citri]|nr:hypothetical protein M8J76_002838 [Diaphorina citri]
MFMQMKLTVECGHKTLQGRHGNAMCILRPQSVWPGVLALFGRDIYDVTRILSIIKNRCSPRPSLQLVPSLNAITLLGKHSPVLLSLSTHMTLLPGLVQSSCAYLAPGSERGLSRQSPSPPPTAFAFRESNPIEPGETPVPRQTSSAITSLLSTVKPPPCSGKVPEYLLFCGKFIQCWVSGGNLFPEFRRSSFCFATHSPDCY